MPDWLKSPEKTFQEMLGTRHDARCGICGRYTDDYGVCARAECQAAACIEFGPMLVTYDEFAPPLTPRQVDFLLYRPQREGATLTPEGAEERMMADVDFGEVIGSRAVAGTKVLAEKCQVSEGDAASLVTWGMVQAAILIGRVDQMLIDSGNK